MEKISTLFPGQGSQFLGMLTNLISLDGYVEPIVQMVKQDYGIDLLAIEKSRMPKNIMNPSISQPLILISSIGYYHFFKEKFGVVPDVFTGHSMGEISALVCAEKFDMKDAIDYTIQRGKIIEKNYRSDFDMVAIIGKGVKNYERSIIKYGEISNINDENQIVVTVLKKEYQLLEESVGKQYIFKLGIQYPFHTSFMSKIVEELRNLLRGYTFYENDNLVYSSTLLKELRTTDDMIEALSLQVVNSVNWLEVLHYMGKLGIGKYVEVGAGKTLKNIGLLNDIEKSYYSISDLDDVNQFVSDNYNIKNSFIDNKDIFEFISSLVKISVSTKNMSTGNWFVESYKRLKKECERFVEFQILPTPIELNRLFVMVEQVLLRKGYPIGEIKYMIMKEMIQHNVFDIPCLNERFASDLKEKL